MEEIFFWKKWSGFQKSLFVLLLGIFISAFISYIYFASQGIYNVLNWETNAEIENLTIGFDHFTRYMIDFNVEAENYITSQFYVPTPYQTHAGYGVIYFFILAFCATLALTAISTIKTTYWFSGLITLFMTWLTFLHLDTIGLFGFYSKGVFLVILASFVGLAFYFQAFAQTASWVLRFVAFFILMGALLFCITQFSDVPDALFLLSANSYYVVMVLSIVFIFIVSYDILTLFLFINAKTRSFNPKNNIYNFLGISLLYLAIPLLLFLQDINAITFNVSYFNVFYLLAVSSVVGIWAQKYRSAIFKGFFPYQPAGAILMLVLAIITFSSIAYAHATWNTPVIDFFSKIILYSHVSFGIAFFAYAVFNFAPALMQNVDISNYIFTPKDDIPYYTVRIVGFAILIVILKINNFVTINNFNAGVNNYKGDVSYHLEDDLMADYYYQKGLTYSSFNFKSTYPLSELSIKKYKFQAAKKYVNSALFAEPHPLTYSANQYIYELNNDAFYNIWKLEEGTERFPNDPYLKNNLAITYQKEGLRKDTCLYLYDQALALAEDKSMIQSNMIVFCAKNDLLKEADSLMMKLDLKQDVVLEANKYAVWNALEKPYTEPNKEFIADTLLNVSNYTYLHNAVFRQLPNQEALNKKIAFLSTHFTQSSYAVDLLFLRAIQLYYLGDTKAAKILFDKILVDCKTNLYPYYANIFGELMFKIERDDIAREYFRKSYESQQSKKINKSPLYYALSSASVLDSDSLAALLVDISQYDSTYKYFALELSTMIQSTTIEELKMLKDYQKVQYLEISKHALNLPLAEKLLDSFVDTNLKALACSKLIARFLNQNNLDIATHLYSYVPTNISNRFVGSEMHVQFLNLLLHRKSFDQLLEEANTLDFVSEDVYKVHLLQAKAYLAKRNFEKVDALIEQLDKEAPLYTDAIVFKSSYLNTFKKESEKAYDLLIEAIDINPTSIELKKQYTLIALDLYMDVFAETTLEELRYKLSKTAFDDFLKVYVERKAIAQENFNNWN